VVTTADGIVLRDNGGAWPSIVLRRYGNDTLSATLRDAVIAHPTMAEGLGPLLSNLPPRAE
jgi:hypothetical protein